MMNIEEFRKKKIGARITDFFNSKPCAACTTGIASLDTAINGGWKAGTVVALGGIPGIGKTTLALLFARAAAKEGHSVLDLSTEQSADKETAIMICQALQEADPENKITLQDVIDRKDESIRDSALQAAFPDNLTIIDASDWEHTAEEIPSMVECLLADDDDDEAENDKFPVVIIDSLQQIRPADANMTYKDVIDNAVSICKHIAVHYNVAVLILSAVNRDYYDSVAPVPLQALYGSSAIDYAMDLIITVQMHGCSPSLSSVAAMAADVRKLDMTVIKQKDGPVGRTIHLEFDAQYCCFASRNGEETVNMTNYENHVDDFLLPDVDADDVVTVRGSLASDDDYDDIGDLFFAGISKN
ncbi:MAG: AAA family ATPase [Lachnospiraceae bacterium]|nr:AAA family ATPase [Lachnospiraceae bacterium]